MLALVEGAGVSLEVEAEADEGSLELADVVAGRAEEGVSGEPTLVTPADAVSRARIPGRAEERVLRDAEAEEDASEDDASAVS